MSLATLKQLVDVTAAPPVTSDPDELLVAFGEMYLSRQELLDTLSAVPDTEESRALVAELAARDAVWEAAMVASRDAIGSSRRNTTRLRVYAK